MHGPSWPAVSSTQAVALAQDWLIFTCAALSLAVLVWVLIIVAAIRFRRTDRNPEARSQRANNAPLEIVWTILPLLIVVGLFAYTYHIEAALEALAADAPVQLNVNGFRWAGRLRTPADRRSPARRCIRRKWCCPPGAPPRSR